MSQNNEQVMRMALAYVRWREFGECRTAGWEGPPPTAAELDAALVAALAAQATALEVAQKNAVFLADQLVRQGDEFAQAGQSEPVAWAIFAGNGNMRLWSRKESYVQAKGDELGLPLVPLYTHPAPVRQPLTDEQSGFLVIEHLGPAALARDRMTPLHAFHLGIVAAENFHGITAQESRT